MIYTVTFNPALDYVVRVKSFTPGALNRCIREELYCGGKGINVSTVLTRLGVPNTALGFVAGFTGDVLRTELAKRGVAEEFIRLENGFSRINVKIKSEKETEINGQGPDIDSDALHALYERLDGLKKGDILVLAGSIPKTLPEDIYERILERLSGRGILYVVDATGELLLNVLKYQPFLIKPNQFELEEIFGVKLKSNEDIIDHAKQLRTLGARNVLVSLGGQGAILADESGQVHHMGVFPGKVSNSVGAGDSMVAGFLYGWLDTGDYGTALRCGTAAGCATAFADDIATKDQIMALLNS